MRCPWQAGNVRTPESYDRDAGSDSEEAHGIKFNSIFNHLTYYHVCQPGLPPCLGHDLFEGVVSYDLSLFLNHMIKIKKWFSYELLNSRITNFQSHGTDVANKPCKVNMNSQTLGGHAVQNWYLLRFLPFFVGDLIQNYEDELWKLCLQLREIENYICAPVISRAQVAYLQILINEYIENRFKLFPLVPLKPKHHYLVHYPELILKFGPLIRLWAMRFEAKHSYFKRCICAAQNYINVTLTMAERHQMLQAMYSSSTRFPGVYEMAKGLPFYCDSYCDSIQGAVKSLNFSGRSTSVSDRITVRGIAYKRDDYVIVDTSDIGYSCFAIITMILLHKGNLVYFLVQLVDTVYEYNFGLYEVKENSSQIRCININDLKDLWPLHAYNIGPKKYIAIKHQTLTLD